MNSKDIRNATFSLESEAGPTHSDLPAGPMINKSGPVHVPVSRFRARDSEKAMPTNDTSGLLFATLSPSADLQSALANRLHQRMDVNGSLEYALTWKEWDMPAGPPICALRARAHPISDKGYSGWPTTSASDQMPQSPLPEHLNAYMGQPSPRMKLEVSGWPTPTVSSGDQTAKNPTPKQTGGDTLGGVAKLSGQHSASGFQSVTTPTDATTRTSAGSQNKDAMRPQDLSGQITMAGWPSPKASNSTGAGKRGTGGDNLQTVVQTAGWATPAARDYRSEEATDEFNRKRWGHSRGKPLSAQVTLSGWATPHCPRAHDSNNSRSTYLDKQIGDTHPPGQTSTSSAAQTEKRGALNPAFSLWLMGFPNLWMDLAPSRASVRLKEQETPSFPKSPPSSSKPTAR